MGDDCVAAGPNQTPSGCRPCGRLSLRTSPVLEREYLQVTWPARNGLLNSAVRVPRETRGRLIALSGISEIEARHRTHKTLWPECR
jgi:hypothetical protein